MSASTACTLPAWRCAMPLRVRRKTSQSGQVFSVMSASFIPRGRSFGRDRHRRAAPAFVCISECRLAHPGAVLVRLAARPHALAVARPVAGDHPLELVPIDLAEAPTPACLVELQFRIGDREAEIMRLRDRGIDEFLAQLVVGEALDL